MAVSIPIVREAKKRETIINYVSKEKAEPDVFDRETSGCDRSCGYECVHSFQRLSDAALPLYLLFHLQPEYEIIPDNASLM